MICSTVAPNMVKGAAQDRQWTNSVEYLSSAMGGKYSSSQAFLSEMLEASTRMGTQRNRFYRLNTATRAPISQTYRELCTPKLASGSWS